MKKPEETNEDEKLGIKFVKPEVLSTGEIKFGNKV
jgi:hypothetical protein